MPLENNAIETLSINAVKNTIVMCEYLSQFIADNDKEPTWDGAVYIYDDKVHTKDNLKGRMPVQVKGKECDDFSKEKISFSMSTIDLRNYLYDGGCILFVVYIGNGGLTNKIYYSELTPIKLRRLLYEAGEQCNKVVHLKPFPFDNNKKATIFLNCLQNCQKQASFTDGKLLSLEELEEQGLLENIVIPILGIGIDNPQTALLNNEVYFYANVKGSSILQPIDIILENIQTYHTIDAKITVGDKLFYTTYSIIKSADNIIIQYGESFTMKFTNPESPCKIKYTNSCKIRVLAKDLDFALSYLEKGAFQVNGTNFPFDYKGANLTGFDVKKEKERLAFAKRVVQVLDILGCPDDIDINDMGAEDWKKLDFLIISLLDKKPVSGLSENLPSVSFMKVGKLRFALYVRQCDGENTGKYEISDFFKTELDVVFDGRNGEKLQISQFSILHTDDFLTLDNIDFDILLPSYQKLEHHYETFNRATLFLLEMLSACDKAVGYRHEQLLKVCGEFSEWISNSSEDEPDYQVRTLNRMQVIKRCREFTIDELRVLYELIESCNTREDSRVGAYLLLGQQQAAEIHFEKLSIEEQNNFKKFPIYHFWKQEDNDNDQPKNANRQQSK